MIEGEQIRTWNADGKKYLYYLNPSILVKVTCPQVLCVLLRPPAHPTKRNFITIRTF